MTSDGRFERLMGQDEGPSFKASAVVNLTTFMYNYGSAWEISCSLLKEHAQNPHIWTET